MATHRYGLATQLWVATLGLRTTALGSEDLDDLIYLYMVNFSSPESFLSFFSELPPGTLYPFYNKGTKIDSGDEKFTI